MDTNLVRHFVFCIFTMRSHFDPFATKKARNAIWTKLRVFV